jgi:hypothetical protein
MSLRAGSLASLIRLAVLVPLSLASAQPRGGARTGQGIGSGTGSIVGRVVSERKEPVLNAEVSLVVDDSVIAYVRAATDGSFELGRVAAGTQLLVVRRLGFRVRRVEVEVPASDASVRLDIVLIAMPRELEQVRVEASIDDSRGKLREYYEHRARAQFGYFFGPENLDRDKLTNASDIMRRVPGAKLLPARFGHRILFRGCSPLVVIDGQRAVGAELDEIADIDDIAAVEIYPSMAGLPPQYVGWESRCGIIVVWTRVS